MMFQIVLRFLILLIKFLNLCLFLVFVITKPGGLTTTESLVSGDPLILINPIPGQEESNADFLVRHGVAIWIKRMTILLEL